MLTTSYNYYEPTHASITTLPMKLAGKGYLIFITLLIGCHFGGYYDLGSYDSRIDAQNNALADILKNYSSLPPNNYYKLKYAFPNHIPSAPIRQIEHALWYNKGENQLALEVDVNSGVMCRWMNVTRALLEQANKSTNSLAVIDSLGKPNQPFAQCQY